MSFLTYLGGIVLAAFLAGAFSLFYARYERRHPR
jgi:hypothetical protein